MHKFRERMKEMPLTRSGKREEQRINMWLHEAQTEYAFPDTEYDWYCMEPKSN